MDLSIVALISMSYLTVTEMPGKEQQFYGKCLEDEFYGTPGG